MGCLHGKKYQILIAHQKQRIDRTKKVQLAAKKIQLETKGFCPYFWEVDHRLWDVCMEKNSNSYCSSEAKNRSDKKVWLADKKSLARDQRILHIFLGSRPPPVGCLHGKNSNSYCSSEAKNRSDKKSSASRQKKFGQRLEDFAHIFGKLTTPYGMFAWKKLKFLLLIRSKEQIG